MSDILYLHGLFSTPDSQKAQYFKHSIQQEFQITVHIPQLSTNPAVAIDFLENFILQHKLRAVIGSSMGGYHATWISAKLSIPAVLINPAVGAHHLMEGSYKGEVINPVTAEKVNIDAASIAKMAKYDAPTDLDERLLLCLLQTGDEELNYRNCTNRYQHANYHITTGGNHSYENFEDDIQLIQRHFKLTR